MATASAFAGWNIYINPNEQRSIGTAQLPVGFYVLALTCEDAIATAKVAISK